MGTLPLLAEMLDAVDVPRAGGRRTSSPRAVAAVLAAGAAAPGSARPSPAALGGADAVVAREALLAAEGDATELTT